MLLDMMRRCTTGRTGSAACCRPERGSSTRPGTLSGYTGDVAFVTLPDGRRIAMVLFARGGENRPGGHRHRRAGDL